MSLSPLPRLSDHAQDALAAYREASPGSQRRAANLRAVHERVRAEASPPAAAAAGLLWPLGWGMASAAAAAVLVWGLVEARSVGEEAPRARTEAPAVVALEKPSRAQSQVESPRSPIAPEGSVESAAVQRPTKRSVATPPEPSGVASIPAASDLQEETRRLREVRASMTKAAWSHAARELDAYTLAFPNGALREDAQAYRIIVRCELGDPAQALRRAFASRYPASPHAVRLDVACQGKKK